MYTRGAETNFFSAPLPGIGALEQLGVVRVAQQPNGTTLRGSGPQPGGHHWRDLTSRFRDRARVSYEHAHFEGRKGHAEVTLTTARWRHKRTDEQKDTDL